MQPAAKRAFRNLITILEDGNIDAGALLIGEQITSAGGGIIIAADDTLAEALKAIIDAVDPA